MRQTWWLMGFLIVAGTNVAVGDEPKPSARPSEAAATGDKPGPDRAMADRFAALKAEHHAKQAALWEVLEKAKTQPERVEIFAKTSPDAPYSRRMIELAESKIGDPTARDALIWVINKPERMDDGEYGDEFAHAAALLVRHHGDDPLAVSVGLGLSNVPSIRRDALLLGFYAAAKGHEGKGVARLALATYLEKKAQWAEGAKQLPDRRKQNKSVVGGDGKLHDPIVDLPDDVYAYVVGLRICDPALIKAEAERLYNEVIADYGDIPFITLRHRELEALLKEPTPTLGGKPLTEEDRRKIAARLARESTLGSVAEAHLDEMHNLIPGKPAPEIDGVDMAGKPLKLSDHRGKVVVLVFWGSWCGPCMREVPHERELAERLKDRPFAILGVDCNEEKSAGLKAIESEKITWPNWNDGSDGDGPIVKRYHIRSYPSVFVIDAQGIIRHTQFSGEDLDKAVDALLEELEAKAPKG